MSGQVSDCLTLKHTILSFGFVSGKKHTSTSSAVFVCCVAGASRTMSEVVFNKALDGYEDDFEKDLDWLISEESRSEDQVRPGQHGVG